MEVENNKKCLNLDFDKIEQFFKITGPTYNKNSRNSLAFQYAKSANALNLRLNSAGMKGFVFLIWSFKTVIAAVPKHA